MSHLGQQGIKSSFSGDGDCVVVAFDGRQVRVRDSKDPSGPVLVFTPTEWSAFLAGVHNREFELPEAMSA